LIENINNTLFLIRDISVSEDERNLKETTHLLLIKNYWSSTFDNVRFFLCPLSILVQPVFKL